MKTNEAAETQTEAVASNTEEKPKETIDCLVHLRFNPNGTVSEIGERPPGIDAQSWFNYLSRHTLNCYQALSGGRGLFRLPRQQIDDLKAACVAENAT